MNTNLAFYFHQSQMLFLRDFWQKSIIDYFKSEPISDFFTEFQENIKNIKRIINLPIVEENVRKILYRIIYANVITVMETYLSDCFTQLVINSKDLKLKLLDSSPDFNQEKYNLRTAYDWLEEMDEKIIEKLQNIVFHNLDRIKGMFKNVLMVNFPEDLSDIFRAILNRHDIIHRNGKTKNVNVLEITKEDILDLIDKVEQ